MPYAPRRCLIRACRTHYSSTSPGCRLVSFLAVFAVMAVWERFTPRRRPASVRGKRWAANLGIAALATALVRILFPAAAVGGALFAEEHDSPRSVLAKSES